MQPSSQALLAAETTPLCSLTTCRSSKDFHPSPCSPDRLRSGCATHHLCARETVRDTLGTPFRTYASGGGFPDRTMLRSGLARDRETRGICRTSNSEQGTQRQNGSTVPEQDTRGTQHKPDNTRTRLDSNRIPTTLALWNEQGEIGGTERSEKFPPAKKLGPAVRVK